MEKNFKYIFITIVLVVAAWYVLSGNGPANQSGFSAIKDRISSSLSEQRAVSDQLQQVGAGIDSSTGTVGSIRDSNQSARNAISDAQRANASSLELIQDSRERLERCQQIINRMEEGAGQGNVETEAGK